VRKKNISGPRIREARRKLGITQLGLAARLQLLGVTIDRSGIAKIELGRRPISDIEVLAVAKILKVELPWLFKDGDRFFD
jgi:transcriptional regulator with XRE-family HTH domain